MPEPRPDDAQGFRYTLRPFPPYRHLPGATPHPRRSPEGHMFGKDEVLPAPFDASRWSSTEDYLYGVDLYNFAYYWEAHEAWEGLWRTTERGEPAALFLQGMIQLAAALLKREQGSREGMKRLAGAGLARLRRVAETNRQYCGVDLEDLVLRLERISGHPSEQAVDPRIHLTGIEPSTL